MRKIIFVTGTDTGVGKTLLTGLLLCHLRRRGVNALAMKPFCSGGRNDIELIQALQNHALPDEEVNPFYFPEPLAPLVAARKHRRRISLSQVLRSIERVETQCEENARSLRFFQRPDPRRAARPAPRSESAFSG